MYNNRDDVIIMIGQRLKKLRCEKKVRQEDLATILGVQKATVSHYETGKADPSDKVKIEIAKYFDVSMDYLMGIIDETVPHYQRELFIRIPQKIKPEEREMLEKFVTFIAQMNNL